MAAVTDGRCRTLYDSWRSWRNHKLSDQRGDRADGYDRRNRRGDGVNRILGTYADG